MKRFCNIYGRVPVDGEFDSMAIVLQQAGERLDGVEVVFDD